MLPWVVRELTTNTIVGSTRYHDIVPAIDRVEIGYTWYAGGVATQPRQHRVQAAAADPRVRTLGCKVVGLRTDNFNFTSQRAIAALGAQ